MSKQRDFYRELNAGKSNRITEEKITKLESVGFRFYIGKGKALRTWDVYFNALLKFKEKYGHTNIPLGYADDPNLGKWAYQQRLNFTYHVKGRSTTPIVKQRLDQLKNIGFNFYVDKKDKGKKQKKRNKKQKKRNEGKIDAKSTEETDKEPIIHVGAGEE